jgi:hypothetical protein
MKNTSSPAWANLPPKYPPTPPVPNTAMRMLPAPVHNAPVRRLEPGFEFRMNALHYNSLNSNWLLYRIPVFAMIGRTTVIYP